MCRSLGPDKDALRHPRSAHAGLEHPTNRICLSYVNGDGSTCLASTAMSSTASAFFPRNRYPFCGCGESRSTGYLPVGLIVGLDPLRQVQAAALAIYAGQSLDETLFKTAMRIQARAGQRAVNGNRHVMTQCIVSPASGRDAAPFPLLLQSARRDALSGLRFSCVAVPSSRLRGQTRGCRRPPRAR
jgi:hypothetical protein